MAIGRTHRDALRCEAQGTVRMLSRMAQNLKARAPRKTGRNQPG
jgi:hypothetical protein